VITLATAGVFLLVPGPVRLMPSSMTAAQVLVLGLGTTLGVIGQAVWVAAALRRSGFRWAWRVRVLPYTWHPVRVGLPMIGWVLAYAAISQVGVAVVLRVAFSHGGVSIYTYSDLIFQVPYGILGVSLLTVLMPRIADAVARGDTPAILANLGRGARYAIVALVPVAVAVSVLAPALAKVMFVGRIDIAGAELIGKTAAASAFGLAPFALVMLQLRVFYAGNDTRTPALINAAMVATKIGVISIAAATLPSQVVVITLGVGSSLSYVVGAMVGHLLLRRRYGLLGFRHVAKTLRRVGAAALVAGGCSLMAVVAVKAAVPEPRIAALVELGVGAVIGLAVFLLAAKVIGITELRNVRALIVN
jgi:putative peptidoglycan lipid II flippase